MARGDTLHDSAELHLGQLEDSPGGLRRALQLFATGLLGGLFTVVGLGVLAAPMTHTCCGGATEAVRSEAETRRRCLELGVTPEELAALDAASAAGVTTQPAGEE